MKKKTKITKVDTLHSISEYKLSNGLRVLLYPVADFAGIVGTCIVYHVGSRNEKSGYTGATHLLEHLLFKESKHFRKKDKNTIFELLEKRGVMINATTSFDRTDYFAVLPTKLLTLALTIEADRMRNAILKPEHLASEMPVVQSELEWRDGRPIATLSQEIWSTAFQAHPYHHPIIGWRSDVESVTVDKLKHFYNDFYHPNNATLILVGDLNEKKTLKQVTELFGDIPPSIKPIDFSVVQEPSQRGSRHVEIRKPGENWVSVCYKNPNALHADMPALIVLGLCLSSGRTSRLYKAFFR